MVLVGLHTSLGGEEGRGEGGGGKNRRWKFELQLAAGSEDVAQEKKTEGFLFTFRDLFVPLVFCPDALFMNSWPNFARCTFNDRGKRVESEVNEAKVKLK